MPWNSDLCRGYHNSYLSNTSKINQVRLWLTTSKNGLLIRFYLPLLYMVVAECYSIIYRNRKVVRIWADKHSILQQHLIHSLIRGVLIQSCSAGAKNFTNYVFCHPQFSGAIQNIENRCAISVKILKNDILHYKID